MVELTAAQVDEIAKLRVTRTRRTIRGIAARFKVSPTQIYNIWNSYVWRKSQ